MARRTSGLDVERLLSDLGRQEVEALTRQAERLARRLQVDGTPSFFLVRNGGEPQPIAIEDLDAALAAR